MINQINNNSNLQNISMKLEELHQNIRDMKIHHEKMKKVLLPMIHISGKYPKGFYIEGR